MSYILDALQRADQERNLGEVPKLDAALQPVLVAERSNRMPLVILALLTGSMIGAGSWLYQQGRLDGLLGSAEPPATALSPPEQTPPAQTLQQPEAVQVPPSSTALPASEPAAGPAPDAPVATAATPPAAAPATAPPTADAALAGSQATTAPQAAPATGSKPANRKARLPTPMVAPAPPPSWVNEEKREQGRDYDQAAATLTSYLGMPQSFRSSLPALNMNAHVFSTNAARSFVLINNKRYRIGDYLAEGPELVDILPDGAVLKHRGESFLLPVQR